MEFLNDIDANANLVGTLLDSFRSQYPYNPYSDLPASSYLLKMTKL